MTAASLLPRRRRVAIATAVALVAGAIVAFLAVRRSRDAARPATVLLVSIDTCRADRLGVAGARLTDGSSPTPFLDRLAAEGRWYPRATTPAPLTLPAHTTVFSGLYPDRHGVRENDSFRVPKPESRGYALLAEELRAAGFETAAFVSAQPLDRRFGLDQGFRLYDDVDRRSARGSGMLFRERDADATVARAARWLAESAGAPRRFLFAHFFDPHHPYERRPDSPSTLPAGTEGDYLAEIVAVDRAVERLCAALPDGGRDAWIVVFGDHGEALGEHGEATHGYFLYDATLRVPLIVRPPRGRAEPLPPARPARLVDVRATLLDAVGVEAPFRDGESLLRPAAGPFRDRAESLYAYFQHRYARLRAYRDGDLKLIEGGGQRELFRTDDDPGEMRDLSLERATEADRLRALLFDALASGGANVAADAPMPPEVFSAYNGARTPALAVEPSEDENAALPHPAAKQAVLRDLDAARRLLTRGDAARAALTLRAHAAERDGNPALLLWTGRAVREAAADPRLPTAARLSELADAAGMFRTLAERWADPRGVDLELLCLRDRAKLEPGGEAFREIARRASGEIAARGGSAVTYALRGLAREALGDLPGAESDLKSAFDRDPDDARISADLARVRALRQSSQGGR